MNLRLVVRVCGRLVRRDPLEVNGRREYLSYERLVRTLGILLVSCCVLATTLSVDAAAQTDARAERPRVELIRQAVESEFGEEIAVRIVGELQALGFEVVSSQAETASREVPRYEASRARIVLNESEERVVVEAWCPTCDTPLVQTWHANQDRSAETIAVRSVEALRASLLVYSQAPAPPNWGTRLDDGAVTAEVSGTYAPSYRLTVGPTLSLQLDSGALKPGVLGALSLGFDNQWHTWSVGVRVGGSPFTEHLVGVEGQAWVSRWHVDGFIEYASRVEDGLELLVQAGAGYVAYGTQSQPAEGFAAVNQSHQTLLASVRGGVRWEFAAPWALAVLLGAETTLDAPVIRFAGRPLATLDHPAGSAGLALSLLL